MRPVGAPDDAVGIGCDQHLRERDAVLVIRRLCRGAIGAGNFHVGPAGFHEVDEVGEARLLHAERGLRAAEMVEYHRHGRTHNQILDGRYHGQDGVKLDVPAARLHPLHGRGEARAADIGIVDAAGCEVEANATEAGLVHGVEVTLARLVVDHGNAPRGGAASHHAELGGGVVCAVDARGDDHHALDAQRLVQRAHLLGRGGLWRVDAAGEEREFPDVAVNMRMAVAGVFGDVEIDRCRRLRRLGPKVTVLHEGPGRDGGEQHGASRQHGFSPCSIRRVLVRGHAWDGRIAGYVVSARAARINAALPAATVPPGRSLPSSSPIRASRPCCSASR